MAVIDDPETEHEVWRNEWPIVAVCLALVGVLVGMFVVVLYHLGRWAYTLGGG